MKTFLKDCKWGRFLLLHGDMVSQYADIYGEWCEGEVSLFARLLRPESNIIEVGANIGLHAVPLSKLAAQGRVICFEPQRILHQLLCANCALNNRVNVHAMHCAVGRRSGTIEVGATDYAARWNYASFSLDRGFDTEGAFPGARWSERVPLVALDGNPLARGLDSLALLKIDVEGLETDVLEGARELVTRHRPVLFVENNKEEKSAELIDVVRSLGYESYWFCVERFRPGNYNQICWKIPGEDINMVCFPKELGHSGFGLQIVQGFDDIKQHKIQFVDPTSI